MFTCRVLCIKADEKRLVDIDFSFKNSFALMGESGSGKSLSLKALLGMLPKELHVQSDFVGLDFELKRGESVALVPQNPFTALSPLTKIKKQFLISQERAKKYFKMVGLEESFLDRFPSDLSGGQLQRVVIAFALALKPRLLLLDEPTTALDARSKQEILGLLKHLHVEHGFKMMLATHDVGAAQELCEDIAIIKDGKIIESGDTKKVTSSPKESYTRELIDASFKNRKFRE